MTLDDGDLSYGTQYEDDREEFERNQLTADEAAEAQEVEDTIDALEWGLSRLCNPYPGAPYHLYGGDRAGPLPLYGKFAGKFDTLPEAIAALLEWRGSYPYEHVIDICGDGADDSGDGLSDDERWRIEEAT